MVRSRFVCEGSGALVLTTLPRACRCLHFSFLFYRREISLLRELCRHPCVVALHDIQYATTDTLYMVFEYMDQVLNEQRGMVLYAIHQELLASAQEYETAGRQMDRWMDLNAVLGIQLRSIGVEFCVYLASLLGSLCRV